MFADAARRRFDVLLFWALDRFSREGMRKTIAYLERLDECGVSFKSYTEPFLDTDTPDVRARALVDLHGALRRVEGPERGPGEPEVHQADRAAPLALHLFLTSTG